MKHLNEYDRAFSNYYDLINKKKKYNLEAEVIVNIIKKHLKKKKILIADVGCGTGNYTLEFAKLGYDIIGYDLSPNMIKVAKKKNSEIEFNNIDFGLINKKFDVIVSLFNVVNSLGDQNSLIYFLSSIKKNMNEKSLFIFDMWNGSAVIKYPPKLKKKIIKSQSIKIIRTVIPVTDILSQVSYHKYEMEVFEKNISVKKISHTLTNHFFTFQQIKSILDQIGFKIIDSFPLKSIEKKITEDDWIINLVCRLK